MTNSNEHLRRSHAVLWKRYRTLCGLLDHPQARDLVILDWLKTGWLAGWLAG